jgi:hypothetical protein
VQHEGSHGDPYVTTTALCESGRHPACPGRLLSLLVPPGTRCRCDCHQQPDPGPAPRPVAS